MKGKIKYLLIYFMLITLFLHILFPINYKELYFNRDKNIVKEEPINIRQQSNLPDDIYTFMAPNDTLSLMVYLDDCVMYYIDIEVMVPNLLSIMKVQVWDPESQQYNIFENELDYYSGSHKSYRIPFGTALSGLYIIKFSVETPTNINVLIRIEEGSQILFDKIPSQKIDNMVLYNVSRVHNETYIEHSVFIDKSSIYEFYIGRVSSISKEENNLIKLNYNITDSNNVNFEIYTNLTMTVIGDLHSFNFSTAVAGVHKVRLRIECYTSNVNIAHAIIGPVNETHHEPSNETRGFTFSVPIEYTLGFFTFIGSITLSVLIAVFYHQKKRKSQFELKF